MRRRKARCSHGLTDQCEVYKRSVTDDFRKGRKIMFFFYECREHGREGHYIAVLETGKPGRHS